MSPCFLVAFLLLAQPLQVTASGDAVRIDLDAVREGISARVGSGADGWGVEVLAVDEDVARLRLRPPSGRSTIIRSITFDTEDPSGRARELASAVALVIETFREPLPGASGATSAAGSEPSPTPPPARGFVSVGGVLGTGLSSPADVSGGARVEGGIVLVSEHLLPRVHLGWQTTRGASLRVNALELGAGLFAGAAIGRGIVWLGGGVFGEAVGAFVRDASSAHAWAARVHIPLTVRLRGARPFVVGFELGPAIYLPGLRFIGEGETVHWRTIRARGALSVGWRI